MNTAGFDHESGYGLIQADAAITALLAAGGINLPTAGFTSSIAGMDVTFTDTSSDSDGSVVAWSWDFAGGNSADVQPRSPLAESGP